MFYYQMIVSLCLVLFPFKKQKVLHSIIGDMGQCLVCLFMLAIWIHLNEVIHILNFIEGVLISFCVLFVSHNCTKARRWGGSWCYFWGARFWVSVLRKYLLNKLHRNSTIILQFWVVNFHSYAYLTIFPIFVFLWFNYSQVSQSLKQNNFAYCIMLVKCLTSVMSQVSAKAKAFSRYLIQMGPALVSSMWYFWIESLCFVLRN